MSEWFRRRQAARVVVFDEQGRVFLIKAGDPADPAREAWWELPGGGMDPGETTADTALRELREEAGILDARIGPVVWTQSVRFTWAGLQFDQDEYIHVAWTDRAERVATRLEALEVLAFQEARWWTLDEVVAARSTFLPGPLPILLPDLVAGRFPDPPLDISPS